MADHFATVEQRIIAGDDWDGTVPTTIPTIANGIKEYPVAAAGGLFSFGFTSFTLIEVERIAVDFNGVATKDIVIRKTGAPDIPIFSSTLAAEAKVLITDRFLLAKDENIVIVSTAAAKVMYARVTARPALHDPA